MNIKNTVGYKIISALILITAIYATCLLALFIYTKRNIDIKFDNYIKSTSVILQEKVNWIIKSQVDDIAQLGSYIGKSVYDQKNLMEEQELKELVGIFTMYQFEKDYKTIRFLNKHYKLLVFFDGGYLKTGEGLDRVAFLSNYAKDCNPGMYKIIKGGSYNSYFVLYSIYDRDSKTNNGYIIIEYNLNLFRDAIDGIIYKEHVNNKIDWSLGLLSSSGLVWLANNNDKLGKDTKLIGNLPKGYSTYGDYQIIPYPLPHSDLSLIAFVPKSSFNTYLVYAMGFATMLLCLFVFWLSARYFYKRIQQPLSFLNEATKDVASGKYNIIYPFSYDDEIGQLAESFQKMASDIEHYQKELQQNASLAAIGRTSAMVAHDIRKPFASIKSLLNVLPFKKDDPNFVNQAVSQVEDQLRKADTMISDVLDYSRGMNLNVENFRLQSLLTSAIGEAVKVREEDVDVKIEYDLQHTHELMVDGLRASRVFINIITNALDAMSCNGMLRIATETKTKAGKNINIIRIGNDGPAIDAEDMDHLFDAFFTKGKREGTGLGLSICHKVVSDHGGKIKVVSSNGWTEFEIMLPASIEVADINEGELIYHSNDITRLMPPEPAWRSLSDDIKTFISLHEQRGNESFLLIADDEPLFRETVRALINRIPELAERLKVIETDSVELALKQFEARKFNYLISDIDMGRLNMDGYALVNVVLDKYPDTLSIIHSNKRIHSKDVGLVGRKNFLGFLPKPMDTNELLHFLAGKSFLIQREDRLTKNLTDMHDELSDDNNAACKKILIVDDEDFVRVSHRIMLKRASKERLKFFEAGSFEDAAEVLKKHDIDIVLSDINLGRGGRDGYDLLCHIRKEISSGPSFYFVSGYNKSDEEEKALGLGAQGYIQAPIGDKDFEMILG